MLSEVASVAFVCRFYGFGFFLCLDLEECHPLEKALCIPIQYFFLIPLQATRYRQDAEQDRVLPQGFWSGPLPVLR